MKFTSKDTVSSWRNIWTAVYICDAVLEFVINKWPFHESLFLMFLMDLIGLFSVRWGPRGKREHCTSHTKHHSLSTGPRIAYPLLFPSLPLSLTQKQNRWWKSSTSVRALRNNRSHRAGVEPGHVSVRELLEIRCVFLLCLSQRLPREDRASVWALQRAEKMAAIKILTSAGLFLAFSALVLLVMAICTDYWYETDARRHRERCKNYANKRNDPGYIYISNHNLPLQMPPKGYERKATEARVKRHAPASATAMESHCSRQFNSTISGLWRKCHREGFDLETEDLIYKGGLLSVLRCFDNH